MATRDKGVTNGSIAANTTEVLFCVISLCLGVSGLQAVEDGIHLVLSNHVIVSLFGESGL